MPLQQQQRRQQQQQQQRQQQQQSSGPWREPRGILATELASQASCPLRFPAHALRWPVVADALARPAAPMPPRKWQQASADRSQSWWQHHGRRARSFTWWGGRWWAWWNGRWWSWGGAGGWTECNWQPWMGTDEAPVTSQAGP